MRRRVFVFALTLAGGIAAPAVAGPPYITDDPQPTDRGMYEIYLFHSGSAGDKGWSGSAGVDFNYGALPNLQLTAVVPLSWDDPDGDRSTTSLGNVELAAKYRFAHQDSFGVDVAVFPRVFLPAASSRVGETHVSVLLPLWLQRSWGRWSLFGGGGYEINEGDGSKGFWQIGCVLTAQVTDRLSIGAEIQHQSADTHGGSSSTGIGPGVVWDYDEHIHLMASVRPGLEHTGANGGVDWYTALLFTF